MMPPTLESIKGGGGSIKVGATGTISNLMSRELESPKCVPETPVSRNKSFTASSSVPGEITTPRKLKPRASLNEASSNSSSKRSSEADRKAKYHNRRTHQIPMLDSDDISLDGTPIRNKPDKKGPCIVEVVDIKCGNADKAWANPITNRLKKLGFSKLSESVA